MADTEKTIFNLPDDLLGLVRDYADDKLVTQYLIDGQMKHNTYSNSAYELNCSHFSYKFKTNEIKTELLRAKACAKLQEIVNELFGKIDFGKLCIYGIMYNLNSRDPVICTNYTLEIIKAAFNDEYDAHEIKISSMNVELFNKYCQKIIDVMTNKIAECQKTFNVISRRYYAPGNNYYSNSLISLSICGLRDTEIEVPIRIYERLKTRYLDPKYVSKRYFDIRLWAILYRYKYLGLMTGLQGGFTPEDYNDLDHQYNCRVELFGSVFNTIHSNFCSMFYDIEKYFGSFGNFFNIKLIRGFFAANPPYVLSLMNQAIRTILDQVEQKESKVAILSIFPVWEEADKKMIGELSNESRKYQSVFDINLIHRSKHKIFDKMWKKKDFRYYDHLKNKYINFANTNVVVMSNYLTEITLDFLPSRSIEWRLVIN